MEINLIAILRICDIIAKLHLIVQNLNLYAGYLYINLMQMFTLFGSFYCFSPIINLNK